MLLFSPRLRHINKFFSPSSRAFSLWSLSFVLFLRDSVFVLFCGPRNDIKNVFQWLIFFGANVQFSLLARIFLHSAPHCRALPDVGRASERASGRETVGHNKTFCHFPFSLASSRQRCFLAIQVLVQFRKSRQDKKTSIKTFLNSHLNHKFFHCKSKGRKNKFPWSERLHRWA